MQKYVFAKLYHKLKRKDCAHKNFPFTVDKGVTETRGDKSIQVQQTF